MTGPLVEHLGPWKSQPVPDTWCVVACEQGCLETWTVDTAEFDPPLTAKQVETLLSPALLAHERAHKTDALTALAYWHEKIRPTLGDVPGAGMVFLRDQYVKDVQQNDVALADLREWWRTR